MALLDLVFDLLFDLVFDLVLEIIEILKLLWTEWSLNKLL